MACKATRGMTVVVGMLLALAVSSGFAPMHAFADGVGLSTSAFEVAEQGGAVLQQNWEGALLETEAASMTKFGIDVSSWQKVIDWKKASKKVSFAILRCGYGSDDVTQDDAQWLNNVEGCKKYGVPFGVYLYSYATNTAMARSEANHVIRLMKEAGLKQSAVRFPIYLDMEDASTSSLSKTRYASIFNTFRSTLEVAGYSRIGIYSSASWWEERLSNVTLATKYRWVAHWNSVLAEGYPKTQAQGCGIWQYGGETVAGIDGEVDANWARNDLSFFPSNKSGKVFRLYNPNSSEHFYTAGVSERDRLKKRGWKYEGVAWKSAPKASGIPVYRLYHAGMGDHHYTLSVSERDKLVKKYGWKSEGVAFYAYDEDSEEDVYPVYRLYNAALPHGQHFFTQDKSERKQLVKKHGWVYEEVAFYAAE